MIDGQHDGRRLRPRARQQMHQRDGIAAAGNRNREPGHGLRAAMRLQRNAPQALILLQAVFARGWRPG